MIGMRIGALCCAIESASREVEWIVATMNGIHSQVRSAETAQACWVARPDFSDPLWIAQDGAPHGTRSDSLADHPCLPAISFAVARFSVDGHQVSFMSTAP